ncbi:MAG: hypothetical protein JW940_38195 [Polyangiaceae bacterium]|nr:hypothetical protein [Polyangiaceae bacterium]
MADPVLAALWKRVVERWEDEQAHAAFLEHCRATDQLVEAAVRYRGMTGDRDRSEAAQKRLQGVTVLALAQLEASRTSARQLHRQAGRLILIVLFTAASVALLAYLRLFRG